MANSLPGADIVQAALDPASKVDRVVDIIPGRVLG